MADQTDIEWPTCDQDGCIGIRLAAASKCLAHAPDEQRSATLKQLGETGEIVVRGVPISRMLLRQILDAAPHDTEGQPTFKRADFQRATFRGSAQFHGVTFQGYAGFMDVTFQGEAGFKGVNFWDHAEFGGATFHGQARFGGFILNFPRDMTAFGGHAGFVGATFKDDAVFEAMTFQSDAWFNLATFQGNAWFNRVAFRREVSFGWARFEQACQLGPLLGLLDYAVLRLDAAYCAQLSQIEVSARGLSCQRTRFSAGVQFRLDRALIVLDGADLSGPSTLIGTATLFDAELVQAVAPSAVVKPSSQSRLLSIQGANVAGLTVSNVNLAECRFAGAYNLDSLRLESKVTFSVAPVRLPWDWRQVIAEERAWRAARSKRWTRPQSPPFWINKPQGSEWPEKLPAGQIAGLYRALRKGREDAKDEPGAADFYYGEMEMRRHAGSPSDNDTDNPTGEASHGLIERAVLTAYWLASGYGLRAWRALAALTVVLIAFAGLLVWKGYEDAASSPDAQPTSTTMAHPVPSSTAAPARPSTRTAPATTGPTSPSTATTPAADRSLVGALLYGARTIIGLNPTPAPVLTQFGEVLLIAVRVLGPLLLGLALLALRGRVKR